ncbi:hypothetical protein ACWDRR_00705 [Kitasatospora sp. NPDC003701]
MSDQDQLNGVHIGAREIYDQLLGVREDVRALAQNSASVDRTLEDHEDRVRGLERWRYGVVASGAAGASALISQLVSLVKG